MIAAAPIAILSATVTDLLVPTEPLPKPVSIEFVQTSAIDESSTTVGIADSDLWGLTKPDGTMDTEAMDRHLDEMQALGVNTVRVIIPWRGVQPIQPGSLPAPYDNYYDWSRSDYIINAAAERGMAVLGVLNHAPDWGDANPGTDLSLIGLEEPPDTEHFAEYVSTVVQRYGDMVSAYEVWNEPNAVVSWAPQISPVQYTEVLKAAWDAIKGPDGPDANDPMVVAGVLGAVVSFPGVSMDPVQFVQTMYANGAEGYFDALSIHPYHYTLPFSEGVNPADILPSPLEQVIAIRQLMLANDDADLRIWATEYGLPTFGLNGVTEEHQAAFIEDFLNAWKDLQDPDGTSYAGPSFIYTLRDSLLNGELTDATSLGIFNLDWTAKLAAQVIKDFIEAQQPQPPTEAQEPSNPPSLAQQIAQSLQSLFQLVQASLQNFTNSVSALVNSLAQAIAAIFNPSSGAAAVSVSAEVRDEVAEGTRTAAMSLAAASADLPASGAAESAASESVAAAEYSPTEEPSPNEGSSPSEDSSPTAASETAEATEALTESEPPVEIEGSTDVAEDNDSTATDVSDDTETVTESEAPVENEGSTDVAEDNDSTATDVTDDTGDDSKDPVGSGNTAGTDSGAAATSNSGSSSDGSGSDDKGSSGSDS